MTTEQSGDSQAAKRNKGQNLVAAYRAARIAHRPALLAELRSNRAALRQNRASRLSQGETATISPVPDPAPHEDESVTTKAETREAPIAGASVFAAFIGAAEESAERAAVDPTPPEPPTSEAPPPEPTPKIPLSAIGFGPGMMIRLGQLGIESVAELAVADAAELRTALGDISRLINVDLWIESARNAATKAA